MPSGDGWPYRNPVRQGNDMTAADEDTEHPFAQYIRILGKGRNGARSLTRQEAHDAMSMIYCYDVEPEQLGAFLMLLRVKEETAEEVAGFAEAIRTSIPVPDTLPRVSIDWPSYAGKRRHLPWYLLAAMLLGRNGYPVFMHGLSRDDGRVYTRQALEAFGFDMHRSLPAAIAQLMRSGFAYLDVEFLSPLTAELLDTRDLLGLRSPMHTVARMMNPLNAELSLQPVFHPNYAQIHQQAAQIMGAGASLSFKGEGGEAERIPDRACTVYGMSQGECWQQQWPALMSPGKYGREDFPNLEFLAQVCRGEADDEYARHAVTGTVALCLATLEPGLSQDEALSRAHEMWQDRDKQPIESLSA